MKTCNVVGLVLVGWYLMFPPPVERSGIVYVRPNLSAPLSSWQAAKQQNGPEFSSERDCEDFRSRMVKNAKDMLLDAPPGVERMVSQVNTAKWVFVLGALKSKCVADNDARLKGSQ
jgi:hypothetical protein